MGALPAMVASQTCTHNTDGVLALASCQKPTQSTCHSPSSETLGEHKVKKIAGQDKDKEINASEPDTQHSLNLGKTDLNLLSIKTDLDGDKQRQQLKHFPPCLLPGYKFSHRITAWFSHREFTSIQS